MKHHSLRYIQSVTLQDISQNNGGERSGSLCDVRATQLCNKKGDVTVPESESKRMMGALLPMESRRKVGEDQKPRSGILRSNKKDMRGI